MANKFLSYESLRRQRLLLIGLVLALITVIIWITLELTLSQHTSQVDPELRELAKPMNPTLNTKVLDQIKAYEYISPQQARKVIEENPIIITDEESPMREPIKEASEVAIPTQINPDAIDESPIQESPSEAGNVSPNLPATAEPGLVQP